MSKDNRMVHWRIKKTAEEMAGAYYEHAASRSDAFYKAYPHQKKFIRLNWPNFVYFARQVLTDILANNAHSDQVKAEIFEALLDDSTLPFSHVEDQIINVPH